MRYLILLYSLIVLFPLAAQQDGVTVQCPVVKIEVERLADLNIPRYGHSVLLLNGEPTVIGGHTTNFVPTPTLEYYKDGKWHMVQTAFIHDDGFAVQLTSGKVLIGGENEKNMGIGQSYEVELYDPETLTSEGFASLDTKRAMASALALDDGSVVITGNWHHEDAIEIYDGKNSFLTVKEVSMGRCTPFILQTAKDDAIIIGASDTVGRQITHQVVDRLHGEPYHVPFKGLCCGHRLAALSAMRPRVTIPISCLSRMMQGRWLLLASLMGNSRCWSLMCLSRNPVSGVKSPIAQAFLLTENASGHILWATIFALSKPQNYRVYMWSLSTIRPSQLV